jgi:chromosome partitioning protein
MAENKIILFANIKGGVGKTALCSLFATYLAEKGLPVVALDADLQQSLYRHRMREQKTDPDASLPWQIASLDMSDEKTVIKVMDKMKQVPGYVLIDCPGTLNDKNLLYIFKYADFVIVPISYDADTIDATGIFIKIMHKTNPKVRFAFLPNRINDQEGKAAELEQRKHTIEILGSVGRVAPRIKQSVVVKRYTTLYPLDIYQRRAVEYSFETIIEEINK